MHNAALTETIIGCAIKVHKTLGPGFLESVYEKALAHELSKAGLQVECQRPVKVTYDGIVVGCGSFGTVPCSTPLSCCAGQATA